MPIFNVGYTYPKARDLLIKAFPILRTDSSTQKGVIPKDAVIAFVVVHQQANAVTAAASYNLGTAGTPTGVLNAFSLPTTSVGLAFAGAQAGSLVGTKLTADAPLIGTFGGGSSAGGTGVVYVGYYMVGPGEDPTD